jgi:hypothetical protein
MSDEDMVNEALRIFQAALQKSITLRLLGGIAFRLKCPSSLDEKLKRHYQDIDFFGLIRQKQKIGKLFISLGYKPRIPFNVFHDYRLIFEHLDSKIRVDVFLSIFEMSHKFNFERRIFLDEPTLSLADLLLTKLQAFEFTEREYKDVLALLKHYELTNEDGKIGINQSYVAKLCKKDWGLCRTVTLNLKRIEENIASYLSDEDLTIVLSKIYQLNRIIGEEPKSIGWKLRAIIGERLRWYETPEEIQ